MSLANRPSAGGPFGTKTPSTAPLVLRVHKQSVEEWTEMDRLKLTLTLTFAAAVHGLAPLSAEAQRKPGPVPTFKRSGIGNKTFPSDARGGRIAFGDVDRDGDPDMLLSGKLLLNDGTGKFTWAKGSNMLGGARAAVFLDFDRDGDLDVFKTAWDNSKTDRLYRNDTVKGKRVRFTEVTTKMGTNFHDRSAGEGIGVGDLNGDGYPDIYVANYESGSTADRLYMSDGRGKYRNTSNLIQNARTIGRGVSMVDFDRDGDTDIFVSNYRLQANLFWVNQRRQTATTFFRNMAMAARVAGTPRGGGVGHTIGSAWGDLDNDGDIDLLSANLAHPGWQHFSNMTQIMLNNPGKPFTVHESGRNGLGIAYEESHSNPTLFDADNDGDLDAHLTSIYDDAFLYRNRTVEDGKLTFRNITERSKTRTYLSWGAASADVDGDGDLDLVVSAAESKPVLFRNQIPAKFKSVRIRLVGRRSEKSGLGTTVRLQGGGAVRQVRQLISTHGTTSQSEPILHFGVGTAKGPHSVRVQWPSGRVSNHKLAARVAPYRLVEPKTGRWSTVAPATVFAVPFVPDWEREGGR